MAIPVIGLTVVGGLTVSVGASLVWTASTTTETVVVVVCPVCPSQNGMAK